MNVDIIQLGALGAVLMVLYEFIKFMRVWVLCRGDGEKKAVAGYCADDPGFTTRLQAVEKYTQAAYQHAKENKDTMRRIRDGVAEGKFGCAWKDRDEVLEMVHAIKENTTAINYLTIELRKQNGRR